MSDIKQVNDNYFEDLEKSKKSWGHSQKSASSDSLVVNLQEDIVKKSREYIQNNDISTFNAEIEDLDFETLVDESKKIDSYKLQITDGYDIKGYVYNGDETILMGTKKGEKPRLYSFKDGKLSGFVTLDLDKDIVSSAYDEKTNTISVKTADGKSQIYDMSRVSASIKLAQKYEGADNGKYYATDGEKVVEVAESTLGSEYVYGACSPGAYDCSGLVAYCLTGKHERIGTTYTFLDWPETSNPEPGDVCVNTSHTGIYIGDGQMIHAATEGVGVIVGPVQDGMKYVKYPGD